MTKAKQLEDMLHTGATVTLDSVTEDGKESRTTDLGGSVMIKGRKDDGTYSTMPTDPRGRSELYDKDLDVSGMSQVGKDTFVVTSEREGKDGKKVKVERSYRVAANPHRKQLEEAGAEANAETSAKADAEAAGFMPELVDGKEVPEAPLDPTTGASHGAGAAKKSGAKAKPKSGKTRK